MMLDLAKPEAREIVRRMVPSADVLVENFRPGTMQKLDLGEDQLRPLNPGLIYCSISGYGQQGPLRRVGAMIRSPRLRPA
jgi:crotonobetainyl-CoA:carnitine CoA-transferase CaiB-like acyl-CoA transferase